MTSLSVPKPPLKREFRIFVPSLPPVNECECETMTLFPSSQPPLQRPSGFVPSLPVIQEDAWEAIGGLRSSLSLEALKQRTLELATRGLQHTSIPNLRKLRNRKELTKIISASSPPVCLSSTQHDLFEELGRKLYLDKNLRKEHIELSEMHDKLRNQARSIHEGLYKKLSRKDMRRTSKALPDPYANPMCEPDADIPLTRGDPYNGSVWQCQPGQPEFAGGTQTQLQMEFNRAERALENIRQLLGTSVCLQIGTERGRVRLEG